MRLIFRPIDKWPRAQTVARQDSPFFANVKTGRVVGSWEETQRREVKWSETLGLLEKELNMLNVREVVLQLALTDADLRLDGEIKANARLRHPGVILTFTKPSTGPLSYVCDRFTTWQANVRAVAKGLEALRLVERYGIADSGEQYIGWKQLGSGIPLSERVEPEEMSLEQAARVVVGWVSGTHDLSQNARMAIEDADFRRYAYRQALKHLHPDTGGDDSDAFLRLQRAIKTLDENDA